MTEVFETDPSNAVVKFLSAARRGVAVFATLAGLAMLASPIHGAFGAQTSQVRDVDDPGRIPYQSTLTGTPGPIFQFFFPPVPAGHRLVIQHISGDLNFSAVPTSPAAEAIVFVTGGGSAFSPTFTRNITSFDQLVQLYVDGGEAAEVTVNPLSANAQAASGFLTLTGYLLDCAASPCAKIAK
jgi:hypothetical protein